ncbi:MAG: hypothetical protein HC835_12430 [Oscillatoriales cyanobacterium RM2_1_1]|nr:hypothetical protein [Oscillatoriales cyanobacterium SM2_3_0]NJO46363.1 hypothetical protein [Oscillatoriales cyanobacterium RM2_1_1]
MQADLEALELTPGELRHLSGIPMSRCYRPATRQKLVWEIAQVIIVGGMIFLSYTILALVVPSYSRILWLIHLGLALGLIVDDALKILITLKHRNLIRIFEDVERYNATIKAVDIYDKVASVPGNPPQLYHRADIIKALQLLREDLVRALETEAIFRKNRRFLREHQDLFATNLTALTALQISDRSTNHGRLLNEALQVATNLQAEAEKLQTHLPPA